VHFHNVRVQPDANREREGIRYVNQLREPHVAFAEVEKGKGKEWDGAKTREKANCLIDFNKLSPLSSIHEHAESVDGMSPDPGSEVLGAKFISTRWRPAGLPSRLTCHPVGGNRHHVRVLNLGLLVIRDGGGRASYAKAFI
jgi:hypothetical protein